MNLSPSLRNTPFGPMLKHWRLLNRVKQLHAAQMFGVCQSTISRWESGVQDAEPEQRARIEALLKARLSSAADHALARLVSGSSQPVHLVCDLTHRLLACSAPRETEFHVPVSEPGRFAVALRYRGNRHPGTAPGRHRLATKPDLPGTGVCHWRERLRVGAYPAQPVPLDTAHPVGWLDCPAGRNALAYLMRGRP
ncbi:hypothetical protein GLGCALEP_04555 [Pseudomonas sp. MM221]|nr:hypothetical protein GLGCALEP_04555 [Pseudomonas sp. MM221]